MQQLSPWTAPDAYCQAVNGWTVTVTTPNPACQGFLAPPACGITIPKTFTTTYVVWASDHVFCLSGTTELWLLFLFLAGALWVLFTVLRLFHTFDWRGLSGFSVGEIVKAVGGQVALLVVAVSSFSLLLLVHQANFQIINSLVGSLPPLRVDSLWGKLNVLLSDSQAATQHLDPNAWTNGLFGGNLPDNSAPFGLTWGQIFGGIGSLESFLLSTLLPVRFAALFIAVVTAPLAILTAGLPQTRRFFWIWFDFWLEVELLATGSALAIAAYQQLRTPLTSTASGSLAPTEQAMILLAFAGLVCGANLAFLWKIIGSFLANITSFYQQQYQRERQFWGILAQAALGVVGAAATILTDGAALPFVLAAEGALGGVEEAGAVPASPVPGSGIGRTFLSAGGAYAWRNANTGSAAGGPRSGGPGGGGTGSTGGAGGPAAGGGTGGTGGNVPGGAGGRAGATGVPAPVGSPGSSSRNAAGAPGALSGTAAGGTVGGGSAARPGQTAQPAPMQAGPSTPAPAGPGSTRSLPAGGGGGALDPWWTHPPAGGQANSPQPSNLPPRMQVGLQVAQGLPAVLDQMPLSAGVQQRLFTPWQNSRGEEIDAREVFRSYFWNEAHPDKPLQFQSQQGKDFLSVATTSGMSTAVSMSSIEYRLRAVPYLQDTVDLYKRGWIRATDMEQTASALGTLYHSLSRRDVYPSQMEQVRDFLGGTASARAVDPDHGFAALLQFIGGLTPPQRGGRP